MCAIRPSRRSASVGRSPMRTANFCVLGVCSDEVVAEGALDLRGMEMSGMKRIVDRTTGSGLRDPAMSSA